MAPPPNPCRRNVKPASGSWGPPGTGNTGSKGHVPTAHRCALGGLTFWAPAANFTAFSATQHIANATLTTTQSGQAGGVLRTETVLHPQLQVTTTMLSWNGSEPLELNISTWVAGVVYPAPSSHTDDNHSTSATCCGVTGTARPCSGTDTGLLHCVTRAASEDPSPKQIWAGLSTRILTAPGAKRGGSRTFRHILNNASTMWGGRGNGVTVVTTPVTLARGRSLWTVTALADVAYNSTIRSSSNMRSPLPAAAALAAASSPQSIVNASTASWQAFWETASVSTPTLPALEWCWYGSLFMTKGFASTDPSVPPSGLYGPWVSSDTPAWNGDYTCVVLTDE